MEFGGQPRPSGACNLLVVPGLNSWDGDDDEGEVVISIRPKSSPLPRRKSSVSDEDSETEPPMCGSRRVSFADAKGLRLVQVKEFDTWDVPKLPGCGSSEGEGNDEEEYIISPLNFSLPLLTEDLLAKVQEQKVELEKIELLPGTTILKGVVRVLNISFTKAVYIRTTLDNWNSHFDLLAEYIPGSSDGLMDCFSFKLTLWPPFGEKGARVDFCIRYDTPVGTFWANNHSENYVLFCRRRTKEDSEKQQKENSNKKSCLKTVSQNSTLENISRKESSSKGNILADVSNSGLEVDFLKTKNGQLKISEEHGQKLLIKSSLDSSKRSHREAARKAKVKDYFAPRNGGPNDTERNESPPNVKQPPQAETTKEKHADVQSFSERNSKSEDSQFVSESLITCSEPLLNVSHVMSPAHDHASKSEPQKSENVILAVAATLAGGESATDIQDKSSHAKEQHANRSVTTSQENSQDRGMSHECISNTTAVSSENLVSQTSSFTFGTVVAPLYIQVFGRAGGESQSVGDWVNPARIALTTEDLNPHTDRRRISCTLSTDTRSNNDSVQVTVINNQESNSECLKAIPYNPCGEEKEACLSETLNDICIETLQDRAGTENTDHTNTFQGSKPHLEDTLGHPEIVDILSQVDLLNPQIPAESLHLQGEAQEDSETHDLQSQTTAETPQCQPPENTCTHIKSNVNEIHAQSHTIRICQQASFVSLQTSQGVSGHVIEESNQQNSSSVELIKDHYSGKTLTISNTNTSLKEDKQFEVLNEVNPYHTDNSVPKAIENILVSGCELEEKTDFTTPETFLEAVGETNSWEEGSEMTHDSRKAKLSGEIKVTGEVAESVTKETLEKIDHCTIKAEEDGDFCLGGIREVKSWEMMVEEEENNIVTCREESETVHLKPNDAEMREKEIAVKTNVEFVGVITVTGVKGSKGDDAGLKLMEGKRQEKTGGTVAGMDGASIEEEWAQVTMTGKIDGEEELTVETEVQKTEGPKEAQLQKGKHFAEIQEVSIERANIQEEEEIEGEEKMEISLNNEGEGDAEWEKNPNKGNREEQNPDYNEEVLKCKVQEAKIVDADSCMAIEERKDEMLYLEGQLDITQSNAEDGLSALVNNEQEGVNKRVFHKENTGEGQNAHIHTEIHQYKEEGFQSSKNVTHDSSRDENESITAVRGFLTDEPENDQTNQDSASAESDSDDEVELYMYCLRAAGTGAQGRSKDTGFTVSKRPAVSRVKLLSTTMPCISESQDEGQHLSCLREHREDMKTDASVGQKTMNQNVSWWKDSFSCSNIAKTLLLTTLLLSFLVVAYHYDFLACLGLYLISVVWLCCRGEKQPVKNSNTTE